MVLATDEPSQSVLSVVPFRRRCKWTSLTDIAPLLRHLLNKWFKSRALEPLKP
jgi:hypothetical protein